MARQNQYFRFFVFCLLAPLGVVAANNAQPGSVASAPVTIPFVLVGTQVMIDEVWVNDQGPYRFQLDTGAQGHGRLDDAVVDALALQSLGETAASDTSDRQGPSLPVWGLRELRLPGLRFSDLEVLSRDYNGDRAVAARGRIDGILGIELFAEKLLTIDYPNNRLLVSDQSLSRPNGKDILPLDPEQPVPAVPIRVAGNTHSAYVDTGAMPAITLPASMAETLSFSAPPQVVGQATSVAGDFPISMGTMDGTILLGSISVANPQLFIAEGFGTVILGAPFLRRFTVTIDQRNHRIQWQTPESPGGDKPGPRRSYGIMMGPPQATQSFLPVLGVVRNSIAEEQGLQRDDQIVQLNQRPVAQLTRSDIEAALRRSPLTLGIRRQGRLLDIRLSWDAQ